MGRPLLEVTGSGVCAQPLSVLTADPGTPCLIQTHRFVLKNAFMLVSVHVTVLPLDAREGFRTPGAEL